MSDNPPEVLEDLLHRLPDWMEKHGSDNEVLLAAPAEELNSLDGELDDVYEATHVELAKSDGAINELAKLVDVEQTQGSTETFRAKTLIGYARNTAQGTISDVLDELALLFDVDIQEITYRPTPTPGVDRADVTGRTIFEVPIEEVENVDIPEEEIINIFNDFVAAGYEINILKHADLVYGNQDDYNYDTSKATYGTLDSNGDEVSGGGGYAGFIDYTHGI